MKSETMSIDDYIGSDTKERFDFIYENFSVISGMIKDYKEDLITEVMEQKAYNRRAANGELGVRIQISMGISNPTQNKAIEHSAIKEAIECGFLDEDFFEDTDDRQELIRKVTCYLGIQSDVTEFEKKLRIMPLRDQKIVRPYIQGEKSITDLVEDLGIEYQSVLKKVYRIRKKLCDMVEPQMVVFERSN